MGLLGSLGSNLLIGRFRMVLGISCSNAPRLEENGEVVQAVPFGVLELAWRKRRRFKMPINSTIGRDTMSGEFYRSA